MRAVSADPATVLAVETITINPADRLVILHSTDPALALTLAKKASETAVYDLTLGTLARIEQQAHARAVGNLRVFDDVFPEGEGRFDVAVMVVPKGRDYARAMMMAARRTLRPGGLFYVVGPTEGGAKTCIVDMAEIFGNASTLKFKKRNRIGVSTQPETPPAYPAAWGADPTMLQQRQIGDSLLYTMPGIFSWESMDPGTALLIEHSGLLAGETVLDIGCGNGVLGLSLLKAGAGAVTMTDENLLAVRCARANVDKRQSIEVLAGDIYEPVADRTFDLIVSNPPFHQKFDVNTNVAHQIIRGAYDHLTPGGRLVIVANSFLKYDEVMAEHLARVRVIIDTGRYVILEGRRPEKGSLGKATAAAQGKRGSKRRSEQDEAQRFKLGGEIRTVNEEDLKDEPSNDEIDKLFAELEAARTEQHHDIAESDDRDSDTGKPGDELDDDLISFDNGFDDEVDDDDPDDDADYQDLDGAFDESDFVKPKAKPGTPAKSGGGRPGKPPKVGAKHPPRKKK
jgi:16S rRNA (guanine1207-N2)-methyltransferase